MWHEAIFEEATRRARAGGHDSMSLWNLLEAAIDNTGGLHAGGAALGRLMHGHGSTPHAEATSEQLAEIVRRAESLAAALDTEPGPGHVAVVVSTYPSSVLPGSATSSGRSHCKPSPIPMDRDTRCSWTSSGLGPAPNPSRTTGRRS